MTALFDLWCALSPRIRAVCWAGWTLALSALAAYCLFLSPVESGASLAQQRAANAQRWQSLHRLAESAARIPALTTANTAPFSPLAIALPGLRLRHWQPSTQGGELALRAKWEAIPSLFAYLAERGISVNGFSLTAEKNALLLTLTLESLHD
ncbi:MULTISPECIES: HofO family protein [Citrobacter]|uniref:DNA utilization protein HofO C-terminal domain-containing protein n=1 Tax=Citrobacter sedlakii TaxID=67826 RepID=A0ABS0ZU00_9ENTR|nr:MULTISPECIES: hypothetical protein [Citrobacter]EHG7580913.1 hypothetical protein [Citrobacter sedlakii]EIQ7157214.1 hypothetical protein [Citrobacter sedlakii]MBJ8382292.1 hypothetical protein [Citrobacter sedlakii]MBN6598710.1 hypothetical protein [Citrobacter sedlakii]MCZ4675445.1 hypothetical protein [Citrobacter sedlakii]